MKKPLTILLAFFVIFLFVFILSWRWVKKISQDNQLATSQKLKQDKDQLLPSLWQTKGGEKSMELSGKKVLMVIAPENFRDEELFFPKEILENAGVVVTIASKNVLVAKGMLGATINVDKDLSEIKIDDYDAVVFVGGIGADIYFSDPTALSLVKSAFEVNKVVGAICIAPSILANSGILMNKKATAFPSEAENLKNKGAEYTGEHVTVDGKIVTAKGPEAAREFGEAIKKLLK